MGERPFEFGQFNFEKKNSKGHNLILEKHVKKKFV